MREERPAEVARLRDALDKIQAACRIADRHAAECLDCRFGSSCDVAYIRLALSWPT